MSKIKNIFLGSIPFLVVGIGWWIIHTFSIFPRWIIPSPVKTVQVFVDLVTNGTLLELAWASLQNALIGFVLALIVALILGVLIGIFPIARKIFLPFLSAIYVVPSLAWLPLIVLVLGFTASAIICVIFLSSFKKIIYNVIAGVRGVSNSWILAGKNIGLSRMQIITKIVLPAALPQTVTGIRMGFGNAWRSLVGAEMLVAGTAGLGRFIWAAQWFFDFEKVFAGIIIIALIGVLAEQLIFRRLEDKTLVAWGFIREEES